MNSSTSRTWVQDASLLSRTPSAADIERPDAQIPAKPASSTIFAESPLWASMRKLSPGERSSRRSAAKRERAGTETPAAAPPSTRDIDLDHPKLCCVQPHRNDSVVRFQRETRACDVDKVGNGT